MSDFTLTISVFIFCQLNLEQLYSLFSKHYARKIFKVYVPCDIFIHKSCYELRQINGHPFHPGHWLSVDNFGLNDYRCSASCFDGQGFRYQCTYCHHFNQSGDKREIDLHPECRFLKASIKYKGHQYLLTFVENVSFKSEC